MEALKTLMMVVAGFVGVMAVMAAIPYTLGLIFDRINIRHIKAECEKAGCIVLEVRPWPNHYGVKLTKQGVEHYAKCRGLFGKITWKGKGPEQL